MGSKLKGFGNSGRESVDWPMCMDETAHRADVMLTCPAARAQASCGQSPVGHRMRSRWSNSGVTARPTIRTCSGAGDWHLHARLHGHRQGRRADRRRGTRREVALALSALVRGTWCRVMVMDRCAQLAAIRKATQGLGHQRCISHLALVRPGRLARQSQYSCFCCK